MTTKVTIVDYGIGNLFSVRRAVEYCGAEVTMATDAAAIAASDRVILPGVGAFGDAVSGLRERGLADTIVGFARSGRPLLGICVGMQMLATVGEEFGSHAGLDLISGRVVAVPRVDVSGAPLKIPHIGWAGLVPAEDAEWNGTPLSATPPNSFVYLVHSYHLVPVDSRHRLADCMYGGHRITAAVRSGNVYGCQFHPEKSGVVGLGILTEFLKLT